MVLENVVNVLEEPPTSTFRVEKKREKYNLNMTAAGSSEMFVTFYQRTSCDIPEESKFQLD
jgi:hypothetical protein